MRGQHHFLACINKYTPTMIVICNVSFPEWRHRDAGRQADVTDSEPAQSADVQLRRGRGECTNGARVPNAPGTSACGVHVTRWACAAAAETSHERVDAATSSGASDREETGEGDLTQTAEREGRQQDWPVFAHVLPLAFHRLQHMLLELLFITVIEKEPESLEGLLMWHGGSRSTRVSCRLAAYVDMLIDSGMLTSNRSVLLSRLYIGRTYVFLNLQTANIATTNIWVDTSCVSVSSLRR